MSWQKRCGTHAVVHNMLSCNANVVAMPMAMTQRQRQAMHATATATTLTYLFSERPKWWHALTSIHIYIRIYSSVVARAPSGYSPGLFGHGHIIWAEAMAMPMRHDHTEPWSYSWHRHRHLVMSHATWQVSCHVWCSQTSDFWLSLFNGSVRLITYVIFVTLFICSLIWHRMLIFNPI